MKNNDEVMVSILVAVYNHEKYLDECLNSIVNQKTNFKYEVLVHDDCSTDNSKTIIEEYYKKYPYIIIPFYEEENQYSKGVKINIDILIPNIKGKYFCFCEGDDFWVDENKLQKQFDFLENNKEYKFCVHNSIKVNKESKKIGKINTLKDGGDLTCEDFIVGGGAFVATNSMFSYSSLAKNLPEYFNIMSLDYFWQIYLSSCGKTYCFKDYMSAYRISTENSWSKRMESNKSKYIQHKEKVIKMLEKINCSLDYKYDEQFKYIILKDQFSILKLQREYKKMRKEPYKDIWKKQSIKKKVKYYFDAHFPKIYGIIKKLLKK